MSEINRIHHRTTALLEELKAHKQELEGFELPLYTTDYSQVQERIGWLKRRISTISHMIKQMNKGSEALEKVKQMSKRTL